jgi:DNA modification methylase
MITDPDVKMIEGDAVQAIRTLSAGSIDCVVTDPPYCAGGVGEASRTRAPGQGLRSESLKRFGWFTGET